MDGQHARPWLGCFATIHKGKDSWRGSANWPPCVGTHERRRAGRRSEVIGVQPIPRDCLRRSDKAFVDQLTHAPREGGLRQVFTLGSRVVKLK